MREREFLAVCDRFGHRSYQRLRGMIGVRCPECGGTVELRELPPVGPPDPATE